MNISKEKAIEILELVANDSYVAEVSDANGNDFEIVVGNGSDMAGAIKSGNYSEYRLADADKQNAIEAYKIATERGETTGEGYEGYEYHLLIIEGNSVIERAYIPVGGW